MEKYYNSNNYKYSDITGKIIKASIEVHKKLGCGFKEAIYQKALAKEMNKLNLNFLKEVAMEIQYDDEIIGSRRVDFLVERKILIELKALEKLEDVHQVQLLNYLKIYKLEVGLLINFGSLKQIEIKRLVITERTERL
ncbi:MAG: GxxExxY protein [Candidatus Falkowbacteria bacterium]